jgi:hypothetical protein
MQRKHAADSVFDDTHYARGLWRKLCRSLQLGSRYYLWDLPRYFAHRRALRLPWWDVAAILNPLREFAPLSSRPFDLPPRYEDALRCLADAGVQVILPPARLEALAGAWWMARAVPGDVIECGSYRGATGLLLAVLGQRHGLRQVVLLLDTFAGSPPVGPFDVARRAGEFVPPDNQIDVIRQQAEALGVADRVEVHRGLFAATFRRLQERPSRFAFVHIDANLYHSTWEACGFTLPRTSPGGLVVFDDYNGVCDLGARLAIDHYLAGTAGKPLPLAGSSAYLRVAHGEMAP